VRLSRRLTKTRAMFDDPYLLTHAGLAPLAALAGRAGLPGLLAGVRPGGTCGANAAAEVACLVADMAAGMPPRAGARPSWPPRRSALPGNAAAPGRSSSVSTRRSITPP
jgi:hypothetical protein